MADPLVSGAGPDESEREIVAVGSTRRVRRPRGWYRRRHAGAYALVASYGGRPSHPGWYHNLVADPNVMIQDGPEPHDFVVRIVEGDERAGWWERSVAVFPTYADYEQSAGEHGRTIPVFVAERA